MCIFCMAQCVQQTAILWSNRVIIINNVKYFVNIAAIILSQIFTIGTVFSKFWRREALSV